MTTGMTNAYGHSGVIQIAVHVHEVYDPVDPFRSDVMPTVSYKYTAVFFEDDVPKVVAAPTMELLKQAVEYEVQIGLKEGESLELTWSEPHYFEMDLRFFKTGSL